MRVVPVHAHQLLMTAAHHDATLLDHDDLVRHPPPPGANEMPDAWRNGSVGAYGPVRAYLQPIDKDTPKHAMGTISTVK